MYTCINVEFDVIVQVFASNSIDNLLFLFTDNVQPMNYDERI